MVNVGFVSQIISDEFCGYVMWQGIYTPSAVDAKALMSYKTEISAINANFYKELNTTLYNFREASSTNNLTQLSEAEWIRLNTTFAQAAAAVKAVSVPAKVGTGRISH